ncbi:MAG: MATE family efflux transporter [Chloroflexota bacterium]
MTTSRRTAMLTEPVGKTLTNLTVATIFGMLGMVAFNLADTFFVGQLGTKQLAAMSFTFPVVMVVLSIAYGIGQGGAALIARAIGEGDQAKVRRITTDLILLALLVVIVLSGVGVLTVGPLFTALGAPPDILALIREYMFIWYVMILLVLVPMIANLAIRATGDAKTPSVIMMVAVAVNIALDPLLIFGWGPIPRLELVGAALATAISRAVTLVYAVYVIYFRERMITLEWPGIRVLLDSWRQILYIGVPAAATNMITPLSMGLITRLVATQGVAAVAAFGVASRIDMFALVVIMSLGNVLTPFVGQNWGAGEFDRVRRSIRLSQQFSLLWGLLMVLLLALPGPMLASLFNDNPQVVENVVLYLWIVPLSYGIQGILRLASFALNVLNKPLYSMLLTLLQMFGLYIPLAYLGSEWMGVTGIFGAAAVANLVSGIVAFWVLRETVTAEERKVTMARMIGVAAD